MILRVAWLILGLGLLCGCETQKIFVSSQGDDRALGTMNSPVKTIERAIQIERRAKRPMTICLRDGIYKLDKRLELTSADHDTTICAENGEKPVIDGGREIVGWTTTTINGRQAWITHIPEVAAGRWYFHELFVNGQRRPRPRLPKIKGDGSQSFYRMQSAAGVTVQNGVLQADLTAGADRFIAKAGDFKSWSNLADIDVVVLHYWIEERMPVVSFDAQMREVKSSRRSIFSLKDDWQNKWPRYYVENVFEAMTEPGEWYLDRPSGKLYYLPKPGETPENAHIEAPVLKELLKITDGQHLTLRGLCFRNTDWDYPGLDPIAIAHHIAQPVAGAEQSAFTVPGVISARNTHHLTIENCTIENVGHYAIHIGDGCSDCRIVDNHLHDLGAGAVHVSGGVAKSPPEKQTHDITITDNRIHDVGHIFPSATAIFIQDAYNNTIAHNDIHDTYYTAIQVGWVWGYGPNITRGNLIEKNNIYDIGKGWLSDMGGIYTLGVQPGTIIRGNLIHNVRCATYGAWGLYLDEGSSRILVEKNLCYDESSGPLNLHYGQDNIIHNNIFAFGGQGDPGHGAIVRLSQIENHNSFTLTQNILLSDPSPIYFQWKPNNRPGFRSDWNLLWNMAGRVQATNAMSFEQWQTNTGNDLHSLIADPGFAEHSFTLPKDSPAMKIGFEPIDLSDVGPRSDEQVRATASNK